MSADRPARVLLCDDHPVFAEAVAKLLRNRGAEAVVCRDPDGATNAVRTDRFDVCLMDLVFDGDDALDGDPGVAAIRDVRAASSGTAVIVLTGAADDDLVRRCRASGASAFVPKTASADTLLEAIDRVRHGGAYFAARAGVPVVEAAEADPGGRLASLTAREREVLARMVAGQTAAVVARELGVTYATARTHVQRVLVKLGAHSAVEAVAFAARHGVRAYEAARAS